MRSQGLLIASLVLLFWAGALVTMLVMEAQTNQIRHEMNQKLKSLYNRMPDMNAILFANLGEKLYFAGLATETQRTLLSMDVHHVLQGQKPLQPRIRYNIRTATHLLGGLPPIPCTAAHEYLCFKGTDDITMSSIYVPQESAFDAQPEFQRDISARVDLVRQLLHALEDQNATIFDVHRMTPAIQRLLPVAQQHMTTHRLGSEPKLMDYLSKPTRRLSEDDPCTPICDQRLATCVTSVTTTGNDWNTCRLACYNEFCADDQCNDGDITSLLRCTSQCDECITDNDQCTSACPDCFTTCDDLLELCQVACNPDSEDYDVDVCDACPASHGECTSACTALYTPEMESGPQATPQEACHRHHDCSACLGACMMTHDTVCAGYTSCLQYQESIWNCDYYQALHNLTAKSHFQSPSACYHEACLNGNCTACTFMTTAQDDCIDSCANECGSSAGPCYDNCIMPCVNLDAVQSGCSQRTAIQQIISFVQPSNLQLPPSNVLGKSLLHTFSKRSLADVTEYQIFVTNGGSNSTVSFGL